MPSAIEAFFEHEKQAAQSREQDDLDQWQQWNNQGRTSDAMRPLLGRFKRLINSRANVYAGKNPNIPPEAVRAEFLNHAINAFETYDPNRGAALKTHVYNQMKKGQRLISDYGGAQRIPETRYWKVQEFKDAEKDLDNQLGRPPTAMEIADYLKAPLKQVTAMQMEVRKEVPRSRLTNDFVSYKPPENVETLRLLQYELGPQDQQVLEHLTGLNGKPVLQPGQIAQRLGMSPSAVSRSRQRIADKLKQYGG